MYVLIHTGVKRKQMKTQDEIECIDRRRSSRIIALEEKKKQEREKELALALEKKNNSVNHDISNKGKGKAIMEVWDDLSDFDEDDEGPTKKQCKSKELYQLISSIKELERQSQNASALRTNVSTVNDMLLKHILEIITDFLQRKDPDELFAEPVNPKMVENYYEIVKQPMDFGTMRAKLHEDMYTNLEQFKRDIFLICSNAMNTSPATSKYHEVAEDISRYAKWIFEALSSNSEHFDLKLSLNKRRPGRNNASYVIVPETEKRDMYWPPNKPLVSEVLYASKPKIQLNQNPIKYKESLLRFVEDLGPTAQRVAGKKLEALKDKQLCSGDIPIQNLLENVLGTQSIPQPTPKTPTQPAALNAQTLPLTLPFSNRPFTVPGSATQENIAVNTINASSVNTRDGPYKGKKTNTNDNWNAYAATLLSNFFFNNDKKGSSSGIESSNARGTINFRGLSKDKMVSPLENVSSLLGPVQEDTHQLQLGVNKTSNTRQWNTSTGITNMLSTGSSNNVFARVHPTRVISGPQLKSSKSMLSGNRNSFPGLSLMPQPRSEDIMPSINLPKLSPVSQSRPENSMPYMPSNNHTQLSLARQPRPEDFINLSDLSLVSQPRPKNSMYDMPSNILTESPLVHQRLPWTTDSMPSNSHTKLSLAHQPRPEDNINLSDFSLVSQPRPKHSMYDMPSNNLIEPSLVHQRIPLTTDYMSSLNPSRLSHLSQPQQGESIPSTPYQPRDFQAILDPSNFNKSLCTMHTSHEQVPHQAAPTPSSMNIGRQEESPPQLLWNNDHEPDLALQL
ncbi:Bromodomain and PHD finger-containing protein 3, partial [Mucuna pruriens]